MKRILSLILAALLAASALVACETTPAETNAPETQAPATDAAETSAPETDAPVTTAMVTENGEAKSYIVIPADADEVLTYAAEELVYHVEKVTGATLPVTNEASRDGLAIIIGTPDTNPELNDLFADDIAWLTDLDADGKQYADDGFAIRSLDDKLYIFGQTSRGAVNGVHDFIEDNMGVLWIRADESYGLVYDEMPTVAVTQTNYREKSPIVVRGWQAHQHWETMQMLYRNKINTVGPGSDAPAGMDTVYWAHNMKSLVMNSPLYDPDNPEFWNTDAEGNPLSAEESFHVNFWSDLVADAIAATFLQMLEEDPDRTDLCVCIEDSHPEFDQYPEKTQPFEYAPGQFVYPEDIDFLSTVFYTQLNKIARQVKEVYPNAVINTLPYSFVEQFPRSGELEDNIRLIIAPIDRCLLSPIYDTDNSYNGVIYDYLEKWKTLSNDVLMYNYYTCSFAFDRCERPIWDILQMDFQYYIDSGFEGLFPQGLSDRDAGQSWNPGSPSMKLQWSINTLTFWLYCKLAWDPYADVDALIEYFCDKVYGDASEYMLEYYRLIEYGWENVDAEGRMRKWNYGRIGEEDIFYYCIYMNDLESDIIATLRAAYDVAETDVIKERIRPIKESFEAEFPDE